ncbi:hypothetical protein M8J77_008044 [Diaphorina citri]|nr:hypothetical protein M8J77_008044 [Diaphorina citri]
MEKSNGALEKYQKICLIGEGSFGKVFKAIHLDLKKTVALKIISKSGRSGKELSSLKQECEIQKHLAHPNIIKFIASHETLNEFVLITEFAHMSLSNLLEQRKKLSETICVQILSNLISALYYLHSNRVLHRDLKPQNVLLNKDGVAMLCDFGFARSMAVGTHMLTSIKGTPLYMAPELIAERPYDHTADLWSLGCIAYEIHMGHPPFKTVSILHLIRLLKTQDVTFPSQVSETYKDLVKGLLEKDASQRLSWPELLHHPLVKDNLSSEIESQNNQDCIGFDYCDKRRGSRKSITTIVESDSDENEEWVMFLRTCLHKLLAGSDSDTASCERSFILMLITSLRCQSCVVLGLITHILVVLIMKHEDSAHLREVSTEIRVRNTCLGGVVVNRAA